MKRSIRRPARWLAALALFAALSACTRIPLTSLWALKQFSLENFEPAALRIALWLPAGLGLQSNSLAVQTRIRRGGDAEVEHRFVLHESRDAADLAGLPEPDTADARWLVLKFDAAEAGRVRAMREAIARKAAADKAAGAAKAGGSLHLGVSPWFCRTGLAVPRGATVSAALYWAADKGYVPLLRDAGLQDLLKELEKPQELSTLPAC